MSTPELLCFRSYNKIDTPFYLCTTLHAMGSFPTPLHSRMIVYLDIASQGSVKKSIGTVGGGHAESVAIEECTKMLLSNIKMPAKVIRYLMNKKDATEVGMTCGGAVTFLCERFEPNDSETKQLFESLSTGNIVEEILIPKESNDHNTFVASPRNNFIVELPINSQVAHRVFNLFNNSESVEDEYGLVAQQVKLCYPKSIFETEKGGIELKTIEEFIKNFKQHIVERAESSIRRKCDGDNFSQQIKEGRISNPDSLFSSALKCSSELIENVHILNKEQQKETKTAEAEPNTASGYYRIMKGIRSSPIIYLFGGGHVADALIQVAGIAGFSVVVIEDREEFLHRDSPYVAQSYLLDDMTSQEVLEKFVQDKIANSANTVDNSFIAIMTRGHKFDQNVLLACAKILYKNIKKYHWPRYLGMIGSRRKILLTKKVMLDEGIPEEVCNLVHMPIGLPIGGDTAGVIAVSIIADMIYALTNGEKRFI